MDHSLEHASSTVDVDVDMDTNMNMNMNTITNTNMDSDSDSDSDLTDDDILANIQDRLHGPMSGFMKRYFGQFQYVRAEMESVLEIQTAGQVRGRCALPLPSAVPWETDHDDNDNNDDAEHFIGWLSGYLARETDGARGSWHFSGVDLFRGNQDQGQGSQMLLTRLPPDSPGASSSDTTSWQWRNTHVVGFFHSQRRSRRAYQAGMVHLCRAATLVFESQPTRFFLHGVYLRGWLLELWVFDRSGLYCSEVVDVRTDVAMRLLAVLLSYARMTDQELGMGMGTEDMVKTKKTNQGGGGGEHCRRYVVCTSLGELVLDDENPLAQRDGFVGPGMTCYRARRRAGGDDNDDDGGDGVASGWQYVVKFKWRWARQRPEDEFLRLASEKCGSGLALSLDSYDEIESTANLRRGFRWGQHRRLRVADDDEDDADGATENTDTVTVTEPKDGLARYTTDASHHFQNRILACIVTSPLGRPLHSFRSPGELLAVLRDAVRCHRALYRDARILHQDVSTGNIIIVDGDGHGDGNGSGNGGAQGAPRGLLIDLDSAIRLDTDEHADTDADPDTYSITGTKPFMAIGVLLRHRRTPHHDLESFLYVLVWTIICGSSSNGNSPPPGSRLRQWSSHDASLDQLAARKTAVVATAAAFEETILAEFPPELACLKGVAARLRDVLFASGEKGQVDALYEDVICALEGASLEDA
ncbi:hypothetical protein E4U55_005228 [Claviceps digitariae]|nr:hypothetical protein E4U55_005228 [Claviceps digitariae]